MSGAARAVALHTSMCSFSSSHSHSHSHSHTHRPSTTPFNSHQPNTNTQLTSLLQTHPLYPLTTARLSLQFKEKILCLEIMGVDAGKALSQNPALTTASMESIQSIISFLLSKGIQHKDIPRIISMCPKILTSDINAQLDPVFDFLSHDLKVPDHSFRKVINKCPYLLTASVVDQLKPTLFYLRRFGLKDLKALAYQEPVLLVSSVEKSLIPKLRYLESLGFSKDEVKDMVLRCPSLLTFNIEVNFRPKFEYLVREMGKKLKELKEFPQYFAFSLENRIKPRHMEVLQSGIKLPLSLMLKSTDQEFRELIKQGVGDIH